MTPAWHLYDTRLTFHRHLPDTFLTLAWHSPDTRLTFTWHSPVTCLTLAWHFFLFHRRTTYKYDTNRPTMGFSKLLATPWAYGCSRTRKNRSGTSKRNGILVGFIYTFSSLISSFKFQYDKFASTFICNYIDGSSNVYSNVYPYTLRAPCFKTKQ